jgi:hypothetical protein
MQQGNNQIGHHTDDVPVPTCAQVPTPPEDDNSRIMGALNLRKLALGLAKAAVAVCVVTLLQNVLLPSHALASSAAAAPAAAAAASSNPLASMERIFMCEKCLGNRIASDTLRSFLVVSLPGLRCKNTLKRGLELPHVLMCVVSRVQDNDAS